MTKTLDRHPALQPLDIGLVGAPSPAVRTLLSAGGLANRGVGIRWR